mmetsp:Transcript_20114/g.42108  ORF Transcript_20114/g.42108 Transcript_20114/m.42108 type:complete len:363 (+) Transcript_20114:69-1157(+)
MPNDDMNIDATEPTVNMMDDSDDDGDFATAAPVRQLPWVEKYRPKSLSTISHQTATVETLTSAVNTGNLPHLLFYGPPGTGKTTMALALARTLWGPRMYKNRVLEMNASDERGISIVRNKVKNFANLTVGKPTEEDLKDHPCPPFKLIILDESDTMTVDAQSALRRVIESHSRITRFCLICNYVTRIITPITSRCAKFRFQSLPEDAMRKRLRVICGGEKIMVEDDVIDKVISLSEGDMRSAVTTLQSCYNLTAGGNVSVKDVEEMTGKCPVDKVRGMYEQCKKKNFEGMQNEVEDLVCSGYPGVEILKSLSTLIVSDPTLNDASKGRVCVKIGRSDKALIEGADETLQILNVGSEIIKATA